MSDNDGHNPPPLRGWVTFGPEGEVIRVAAFIGDGADPLCCGVTFGPDGEVIRVAAFIGNGDDPLCCGEHGPCEECVD